MIGRMYRGSIGSQAQTGAKTLMELPAPSDGIAIVERVWIGQTSFDSSENLGTKTQDISITGTGTTTTLRPAQTGDAAYGNANFKTNHTIEPTYGTAVHLEHGFNVLSGYDWAPANDDDVIVVSPSNLIGTNLDVAPSASMDFSYGMLVREIGG